jgi:hypothetical protein
MLQVSVGGRFVFFYFFNDIILNEYGLYCFCWKKSVLLICNGIVLNEYEGGVGWLEEACIVEHIKNQCLMNK